jgi:hypothetical protein
LKKCLPYFSNPDMEENRYCISTNFVASTGCAADKQNNN